MAAGPITSWEIDGETVETVSDFIFLGSKITADGDCSHEIKRHLLLGLFYISVSSGRRGFKPRSSYIPNSIIFFMPPVSFVIIGEGNGNPLQYSSLENPRDRGA